MIKRTRDSQRSKCYNAESLAWSTFDKELMQPLDEAAAQKFIDHILKCEGREYLRIKFKLRNGRIGAVAKVRWCNRIISCATYSSHKLLIVHEVVHHMVSMGVGHNREFTSKLLDLYKRFIGVTESQILRMAFVQYKVKYRLNHTK